MTPSIVDSFAALPVGTWLEILAVNEDPARDDLDKQVGTIALLTGRTEREILNLPIQDYRELAGKAAFLGVPPARLPRAASSYKAGDFTLIPSVQFDKLTTAQYIDFQTFLPEGDRRIVELLSVALVPKGKKYNDGYDIAEVQQAIRADITVEQALSLAAFFLTRSAALIKTTRSSLYRWRRQEKDPKKKAALTQKLEVLETLARTLLSAGAGSTK